MHQTIIYTQDNYQKFDQYLSAANYKNLFIVCTKSFEKLKIADHLKKIKDINIEYFTDFEPNPTYDSVVRGVKKYRKSHSDIIIAIGGGSAIDVSKCIKLFATLDDSQNYLKQTYKANDIKLMAIPTTAGTGSEATRYAVIYYKGEKQSVTDESIIPSVVVFDETVLESLPIYQKRATLMDALSHAIESLWSVNATDESQTYALEALDLIIKYMANYLSGKKNVNKIIFKAANLAGKAINISQTTAGHAMCYKLTSLYKIAHGHAAMLVNSELYPYMINNLDKIKDIDKRNKLTQVFNMISSHLGYKNLNDSVNCFRELSSKLDLYNIIVDYKDIDILVASVNPTRLKNNPYELTTSDIKTIYLNIFDEIEKRK